jgi:hypothetical protein
MRAGQDAKKRDQTASPLALSGPKRIRILGRSFARCRLQRDTCLRATRKKGTGHSVSQAHPVPPQWLSGRENNQQPAISFPSLTTILSRCHLPSRPTHKGTGHFQHQRVDSPGLSRAFGKGRTWYPHTPFLNVILVPLSTRCGSGNPRPAPYICLTAVCSGDNTAKIGTGRTEPRSHRGFSGRNRMFLS